MQINKAIRQVMREKGVTLLSMAKAIGKERTSDVNSRLYKPNMTFNTAVEMLGMFWGMKSSFRSADRVLDGLTRS